MTFPELAKLIDPPTLKKLSLFVDLILEWNPRINLTGFRTREQIEDILIGESVLALSRLLIASKTVLDFGSGAGIPGLVWALCVPEARITSLEVRQKKVSFQKEVVRSTGLGAEIIAGRFPQAVADREFALIVSRAIRFSESLWKEAELLLVRGGTLVRFASAGSQEPGWESLPISSRSSLLLRNP